MERDFLGLSSKDSGIVVKEETVDGCKESAFDNGSAFQWPLSNRVSVLPHFMSFKVAQEDNTMKIVPDPLASSGFMAMTTADPFDPTHKQQSGELQKDINQDRPGGTRFSMTAYAMQQNAHSVLLSHDVKMNPISNPTISVSMSNPFLKTQFIGAGQNFVGTSVKQQLLGGIPITASNSIPYIGSVAGTTEPWLNSKASGAPAQLTIFYGGAVNVYDDISPEKAQAIMFLAGNGCSAASNQEQARSPVQAPTSKLVAGDGVFGNQPVNMPLCSGLSSPMSVSSHPVGQSGSGCANNDEVMGVKSTESLANPVNKVDPPKIAASIGPVTVTTMMPSAVPQARKASLARFLEKRKERLMNSAPYNLSMKSPDECATPGSNAVSFSASSAVGSTSLSTTKDDV